jgi:hypothetical protein
MPRGGQEKSKDKGTPATEQAERVGGVGVPWYRLRVDWTYTTTAQATTAATAVDATLAAQGRAERVVRTGNRIEVIIEPLTQAAAVTLRNALTPNWSAGTRTANKASVVMRDESSL